MVFSSITFLVFFLPLAVMVYYLTLRPLKNRFLLLVVIVSNYGLGWVVHPGRARHSTSLEYLDVCLSEMVSLGIPG